MTGYGSHLYLLKDLIKILKPNRVLETGMGFDSTGLFLENNIYTTSIEMQSSEWYDKVLEKFKTNNFFNPYLSLGTSAAISIIEASDTFDFIFVDGHGHNRWEQINFSFSHTDIIVTHDTEAMVYEWQNVVLPPQWVWIDFIKVTPWTSILTNNTEYISELLSYPHKIYHEIFNKDYIDLRRLNK